MQDYVATGFPSPATDFEERLDLNRHLIANETASYIVRAGSLSMLDAGIDMGDELIIDKSISPKCRNIVVVNFNGDFTCKRLMIEGEGKHKRIWFKAENAAEPERYKNIYPKPGDSVILWGVVTYTLKNMLHC